MGRLENKVAVITGAASGMGRATAVRFAGEGAAVVIAYLNQEGAETTARECRENGGRALFHKTDVTSEPEIKGAGSAPSGNSANLTSCTTMPVSVARSARLTRSLWSIGIARWPCCYALSSLA